MAHDVFISYSHVDKPVADATCAALERTGIRCWIAPRDIAPGADWGGAIIEAIGSTRVTVLIFSASANTSPQIRREVERSIAVGATVIPVRIEDVTPTQSLAYFMSTVHWLDALTPPLEAHLTRLAESIKALLLAAPAGTAFSGPPPLASVHAGIESKPASAREPVRIRRMFSEAMNFSFQRNWLQAVGFYLIYMLIGIIFFAIVGAVTGKVLTVTRGSYSFSEGYDVGNIAGQFAAIPYHMLLGILLLWNRPKEPINVVLVLVSVFIAIFAGAIGGLVPLTILSMRRSAKV